jgi:hypothetical protein
LKLDILKSGIEGEDPSALISGDTLPGEVTIRVDAGDGITSQVCMSKATPVTAEELRSFDAFSSLSEESLCEVVGNCKVFLVAQGWVLQRQGISAKALFFLRWVVGLRAEG